MFITIINDCRDENAKARQCSRIASLFGVCPSFAGAQSDIEAAGNLIDALDASEGREGIILANVAPRNGSARNFENGSPFGFFYHKNTLVLSSVSGRTLSLVKKFGIVDSVHLMDIPQALKTAAKTEKISPDLIKRVAWSQFRSFDFLPRAAFWIASGICLPVKKFHLDAVKLIGPCAWSIDCFGNIKTTLLEKDIIIEKSGFVKTKFGDLKFYSHLARIPDSQAGIVVGSSGLENRRFLEIAVQGGSAADRLGLKIGEGLF